MASLADYSRTLGIPFGVVLGFLNVFPRESVLRPVYAVGRAEVSQQVLLIEEHPEAVRAHVLREHVEHQQDQSR